MLFGASIGSVFLSPVFLRKCTGERNPNRGDCGTQDLRVEKEGGVGPRGLGVIPRKSHAL